MLELTRHTVALLVGVLLLSACDTQTQDQIAREAARSTVTRVVTNRFPGVPVEPAIDCVIAGANAYQIRSLALDTLGGPTESSIEIVTQIVSKRETLTCLAANGLPPLLR
ncbi:hypothetical protein [Tropicibacter sp. S64]|uniref:hypothetical protein n=1 Tax=Tropicibacter sp. S64 TaxID=3415122 RepID=UPI003C7A6FB2